MATLAVVLSICSEADAFVAASLGQFSLTSRLVFLVVVGLLSTRTRHPEHAESLSGHPHLGDVLAPLGSEDHGHGHHGPGRIGYLLLMPVAVLVLVAPSPLGAYAADRASANRSVADQAASYEWVDLPAPVGGASDVTLAAVLTRAISPGNTKLADNPVRLVGFVDADEEFDDGYRLPGSRWGAVPPTPRHWP